MSFESNGNGGGIPAYMNVTPSGYGYGGGFGGGFGFGNDASLILILLLFGMFGGNWGGNGGFGGNGIYPWMNQSNQISEGFQNQLMNANNIAIDQLQASYQGQINALERSFAEQTANSQHFFDMQSQLAQCCCDNRLATCQTQNLVSTEAAATRSLVTAENQKVLDKLCQLELDNLKSDNANLRQQLNMASLAASQNAQTAAIERSQADQTQYIVNRVAPYPVPSFNVPNPYGYCNNGCGCNGLAG